ncbi:MAG: RraA family protein [Armatimonadota bacterium]|nr:RraA family protein [Armatimonadota bacterium]
MDPSVARLSRMATSTLGHFIDEGFLDPQIRPVFRPVKLAGRALTVSAPPRDNAIYRQAIRQAKPGEVLVIHRNGDVRHGSFGGLLALAARNAGIAGAVLDGPCTDLAELTELGLPVFSLGVSALTTRRLHLGGTVGEPITCGGVRVAPGDYVLGDDDGVLVIPAGRIEAVLERGEAAMDREAATRRYLLSGATLDEIDAIRGEGQR